MMKVLDNFHSPPMVMAPWVDYGNYPTLESLIEKKIIYFIYLIFTANQVIIHLLNSEQIFSKLFKNVNLK